MPARIIPVTVFYECVNVLVPTKLYLVPNDGDELPVFQLLSDARHRDRNTFSTAIVRWPSFCDPEIIFSRTICVKVYAHLNCQPIAAIRSNGGRCCQQSDEPKQSLTQGWAPTSSRYQEEAATAKACPKPVSSNGALQERWLRMFTFPFTSTAFPYLA